MFKYLATFILIVLMALFAGLVRANEALFALTAKNQLISTGRCHIDAKGELAASQEASVGVMVCQFSILESEPDSRFFLLFQNGKPHRFIKVNANTKAQETIWRDPDSVI